MITYLFGAPGSGKSFRAIKFSLESLEKDKKVFSNIELLENIDNYIFLDFSLMQNFIKNVFAILEEKDREIEYYVNSLSKVVEPNTLYIIDEAHFYGMNDRKKSELWRLFLSIHRHLHIDILIITQTYKNINSSLLDLGEVFIKALPASKRLMQSYLEYIHYATIEALRTGDKLNILKREKFKADNKIFSLYSSGANNKGSSLLRRKIYLLLFVLLLAVLFIFYNIYNVTKDKTSLKSIKKDNNLDFVEVEKNKTAKTFKKDLDQNLEFCYLNFIDNREYNYIKSKYKIYYAEFNNTKIRSILVNCNTLKNINKDLSKFKLDKLKFKTGKKKDFNVSRLFKRIQ